MFIQYNSWNDSVSKLPYSMINYRRNKPFWFIEKRTHICEYVIKRNPIWSDRCNCRNVELGKYRGEHFNLSDGNKLNLVMRYGITQVNWINMTSLDVLARTSDILKYTTVTHFFFFSRKNTKTYERYSKFNNKTKNNKFTIIE